MFSVVTIILHSVAIIFIGAFARAASTDTTSSAYLLNNFSFLLALTLLYTPYKKLTLHSIVILLVSSAASFQAYILFSKFWDSCFNGFNNSFQLNILLLIRCTFAQLTTLLIFLDFVGIFYYWQVYLILAPIIAFGYSLNSAILISGLKVFDGGGGMQTFLFSGIFSLMIWALCVRGKVMVSLHKKPQYYSGYSLSLIGMVVCFITWPTLNASGGLISVGNSILTSSATLQASGFANTFFCLSVGVLTGLLLLTIDGIQSTKMKLKTYIDCFVNAGIACASYSDIQLNPSAGMVMSLVASLLTLIFYRYVFKDKKAENGDLASVLVIVEHYRPLLFRLLIPLLNVIVCSIVVATRSSRTPALLNNNYSSIAGLQWAGFFITLALGAIFGLIGGLIVNCFINYKVEDSEKQVDYLSRTSLTDLDFFDDLNDDMFPLYLSNQDQYLQEEETARRILRESLLSHLKDNSETKKQPQKKQQNFLITSTFTKSNIKNRQANVSTMKEQQGDEASEMEAIKPLQTNQKQIKVRKSYIESNLEEPKQIERKVDFDECESDIKDENSKQ